MGADLFESYVGSLISALTLGIVFYQEAGVIFPLLLSAQWHIASMIGSALVKAIGNAGPHKALKTGEYSATALVVISALVLSRTFIWQLPSCLHCDHRTFRRGSYWCDHRSLYFR